MKNNKIFYILVQITVLVSLTNHLNGCGPEFFAEYLHHTIHRDVKPLPAAIQISAKKEEEKEPEKDDVVLLPTLVKSACSMSAALLAMLSRKTTKLKR